MMPYAPKKFRIPGGENAGGQPREKMLKHEERQHNAEG